MRRHSRRRTRRATTCAQAAHDAGPLTPLLISAFAFNFNNFVLIALLTGGRPDFLDITVPAGTTDILVSYTMRIAFGDSGQQFGLASAISTVL